MRARWDGDDRGHGVADAKQLVAGATELVAAFGEDAWVAEDPEVHLLPHIERWCERDGRLAVADARVDGAGAYFLELEWRCEPRGRSQAKAAVFALIGQFSESATYVRQRKPTNGRLRFEVGTGELADARFAPHGHVVVIDVAGGF